MNGESALESERLRETLLDLERTRARQKEALDVAAQILRCLHVFDAPRAPDRILHDFMAELRPMLGFQEAFFLAPDEAGGLRVTAATSPRFEGTRWTPGAILARAGSGAPVSVFDVDYTEEWRALPADVKSGVKSALHLGLRAGTSTAFLVCTHSEVGYFAERQRRLAEQLAPLAAQALEKMERSFELARVNAALLREMGEREQAQRALEEAQRELLATARRAGMAEVATNILHNVGNVLNSILTSATTVQSEVKAVPVDHLRRAAELLGTHAGRLSGDRRAELLPEFFSRIAVEIERRREAILAELQSLGEKLDHVAAIIEVEQQIAGTSPLVEQVDPAKIIEEALQINAAALRQHRVTVERHIASGVTARLERHRLLQVLVNLISNARYALQEAPEPRRLSLRTRASKDILRIEVEDSGSGIRPEHLGRIFEHGFTTREAGHGYGLHSGALAIKQMGGTIDVHSDGVGRGARFTIHLPMRSEAARG